MANVEELKERLDRAAEIEDLLDRRIWALAIITECLAPTGLRPVIVGGTAVEFYTTGGYTTFDVDLVIDTAPLDRALSDLGFTKSGRHWVRDDISMAIEAPSGSLDGEASRVLEVRIGDMKAYVLGIEDLIIDRLNAFVHWKSAEDGRWAAHLIAENRDQIDWDYLRRRAVEKKVDFALDQLLDQEPGDQP